jgi:hypothetical protein
MIDVWKLKVKKLCNINKIVTKFYIYVVLNATTFKINILCAYQKSDYKLVIMCIALLLQK